MLPEPSRHLSSTFTKAATVGWPLRGWGGEGERGECPTGDWGGSEAAGKTQRSCLH